MADLGKKYTVLPKLGMNTDAEYEAYRRLMDELGLHHAPCKRVQQQDGAIYLQKVATCIWESKEEAEYFARELGSRTRSEWGVREIDL